MRALGILLLAVVPALADSLVDTDFAGAYATVSGNAKATGVLPKGWSDNSSWANTWVNYSHLTEDSRHFLRDRKSVV
jgi:hypothetical protein